MKSNRENFAMYPFFILDLNESLDGFWQKITHSESPKIGKWLDSLKEISLRASTIGFGCNSCDFMKMPI